MQQRSTVAALVLAALMSVLAMPSAARHLAQAPAAGAAAQEPAPGPGAQSPAPGPGPAAGPASTPSIYGSPAVDYCVKQTNIAGTACTVESDTIALAYPRGSTGLPTANETQTALRSMQSAAQPSSICCQQFHPYVVARCPCDEAYKQLLPIGGFDPEYFEGSTSILAKGCGFDFPPCQPGEKIILPSDFSAADAGK